VLQLEGIRLLVAGSLHPFGTYVPDVVTRELVTSLQEKGAFVETMLIPFHPLNEDAVICQAAAWSLFDFSSGKSGPYNAIITTSFPAIFLNYPAKIIWLFKDFRPVLDQYGKKSPLFPQSFQNEEKRLLLNSMISKAHEGARATFYATQGILERSSLYSGCSGEVLEIPYQTQKHDHEVNEVGCKNSNSDSMTILLCVDRDSLPRALNVIDILATLKPDCNLIVYGHTDCKLPVLDRAYSLHAVEFNGYARDDRWDQDLKRTRIILDTRRRDEFNPLVLEAARQGKAIFCPEQSRWSHTLIKQTIGGGIFPEQTEQIENLLKKMIEERTRYCEYGKNWSNLQRNNTWDQIITRLLTVNLSNKDQQGNTI